MGRIPRCRQFAVLLTARAPLGLVPPRWRSHCDRYLVEPDGAHGAAGLADRPSALVEDMT
jgi:hypothetical protein